MSKIDEKNNIAVQVSGVKKRYRLGQIGGGTLRGDLQSWWAKVRGKEDPNAQVGENQRSNGDTFMALNGIDLTIYQGEAVGIIGRNGAGKSTLLKLLSKVTAPTEGEIDIYGRIASMLEVGTGFNGELTGRENVYMNGAILGMTKQEIDAKMEQIIDFSEVREFIDTPVKRYSSGMFVKLAFSVAAHLDSEIMIMDEVLAVGDMAFQKKCLRKMREAAEQDGRTVLYVSHNMNTIRSLCDRCIVLDKGKVVFEGSVEDSISVYMSAEEDDRTFYDFTQIKRSPYFYKEIVEIRTIEMLKRETNAIDVGDDLDICISCYAHQNFNNLGLRMEFFSLEGTVVGTSLSDKNISGSKGERLNIYLTINLDHFAPGKYKTVFIIYDYDEFGNEHPVDRVDPALCFEMVNKEKNELIWLSKFWGHIKLDDLNVTKILKAH